MWFRKKPNINEENILYVSVDGRSIAVGFYTGLECHYSERRIQIAGETQRPIEILFKDILYAFKHVNTRKIDKIKVILDIPWIKEDSYSIKEKRLKPFLVTEKTVTDMVAKDFERRVKKDENLANLGFIIENIKLNGYTYKDYSGKITDEVEIYLTSFHGDKEIMNLVESSIKSFWNKTRIEFTTSGELLFKRGIRENPVNDMFIHLGSTHTNIKIFSESILSKSMNVDFGFQNIIQKLDELWKTSSSETKHWISMLLNKELSQEEETRVANDIRSSFTVLIDKLKEMEKSGVLLVLERPVHITGIDHIWNELVEYGFKEKFFGEVFPQAETTKIDVLHIEEKGSKGDSLISLYVEEIIKEEDAKKSN